MVGLSSTLRMSYPWTSCNKGALYFIHYSLLALYPGGIPTREPPNCDAPRQPTIYKSENVYISMLWSEKHRVRKNAIPRMPVRKKHVVPIKPIGI